MKKIIIEKSILDATDSHSAFFSRGNIQVYPAYSAEEALHIYEVTGSDMIIVDAGLPVMGGIKLCLRIRQTANLKNVSLILVCAEAEMFSARKAGANAVVPKPIDSPRLFSVIAELLMVSRRKDLRVPLSVSVRSLGESAVFSAESRNISISGMLLETDLTLALNDRLACTFNVAHNKITAECMVVRIQESTANKQQYGVQFLNPDIKSMIIIEQFVKAQSRK
ncbi:MAG: PilZ domain-containing protein [Nitrospirota bacterium]